MLVGRKPGWSKRGVKKFENLLEAWTEKEDGNLFRFQGRVASERCYFSWSAARAKGFLNHHLSGSAHLSVHSPFP